MSQFSQFTDFAPILYGPPRYRLERELKWEIGKKGSGYWVNVPQGFKFDFSVPWIFWWLINRHSRRALPCAALHDYLLYEGYDRAFAASAFRRALVARGMPRWQAYLMYLAVLFWTTLT
jgi:hypothetical protein